MPTSLNIEELNALIQVSKTVNAHLDLDMVLESIMTVTTDVMKVEASSLVLIDDETGDLLFHVALGEKSKEIKSIRMKQGEGIVGWVVRSRKPAIVNDVSKDPRFSGRADEHTGFKTKAVLCVPMATSTRLWGAIEILNKLNGRAFDERDLTFCEAIASQAAIAIENAMLHKQIVKAERLATMGKTIAGLAHCVKNVLNGIQGGSYIVDLGLRRNDNSRVLKGWEIVKRNSAFMQDLVLDMLTYSKDRKPEYKLTDVNEIIQTVCDSMEQKAEKNGVTITWKRNPRLREVVLDPKGIQRCLLNLVSNAIDACSGKQGGHVEIFAEVPDEEAFQIKVSDNGCGISDEVRDKLFQVFFSTKGSKGTGLGLAVTHKIIMEHKGKITVNSTVGQGTTFTITLPIKTEDNVP